MLRGGHCKRRLWSPRSFFYTGLVCVPDDCCKNHGRYCKITSLWGTSSWSSLCLHSGNTGGCSQIAQNSHIGMSRCLDTPSTTQMAKIIGKMKTLWYFLNETCTVTLNLGYYGKGKEKVPNWECMFAHRKQGLFLSVSVDDIKMAGKKQNLAPMWKKWMKNVDIDEPTSFLDHVYLGMHSMNANRMKQSLNNTKPFTYLCWSNTKITWMAQTSRTKWHGPTRLKDMPKNASSDTVSWQAWKCSTFARFRIHVWMITKSSRRNSNRICWRIVSSLLADCLEMLVLGTNWTTLHLVVSE